MQQSGFWLVPGKRNNIRPILASLRWLSVHFRIDFRVPLFVFKTLNGQAPIYNFQVSEIIRHGSVNRRSYLKLRSDHAFETHFNMLTFDSMLPWQSSLFIYYKHCYYFPFFFSMCFFLFIYSLVLCTVQLFNKPSLILNVLYKYIDFTWQTETVLTDDKPIDNPLKSVLEGFGQASSTSAASIVAHILPDHMACRQNGSTV